jgi:hypothetical protein
MNPKAFWEWMQPWARQQLIKSYFDWLTGDQLFWASTLQYGELPDFIRMEICLRMEICILQISAYGEYKES